MDEYTEVNRRLVEMNSKIDGLTMVIEKIAVQGNRLSTVEKRMDALWTKMSDFILPLALTCPRKQTKWIFCFVVPLCFTQIGIALKLLGLI